MSCDPRSQSHLASMIRLLLLLLLLLFLLPFCWYRNQPNLRCPHMYIIGTILSAFMHYEFLFKDLFRYIPFQPFLLQLLRLRRPFVAYITDALGNKLFRVRNIYFVLVLFYTFDFFPIHLSEINQTTIMVRFADPFGG